MKDNRKSQMMWLLGLTALSLVPVYILIGWQTGGHSSQDVDTIFWKIEAGAWGLRALVEAWALIYLFQTHTELARSNKILVAFEVALISLVALTVGLVIVANGDKSSLATGLPKPLYWIWSFGVAAFAPLMMGSVGFAYKVHKPLSLMPSANEIDILGKRFSVMLKRLDDLEKQLEGQDSSVTARRLRVSAYKKEGLTRPKMAELEGVSEATIGLDIKALGLNGVGK